MIADASSPTITKTPARDEPPAGTLLETCAYVLLPVP